jgi:hypothetical protein
LLPVDLWRLQGGDNQQDNHGGGYLRFSLLGNAYKNLLK